jgi:branched-chain amino acid transport system permease protein
VSYLIDGLISGATYALVATGVVIVFNAIRVLQFAQGAIVMLASYLFLEFYEPLGRNVLEVFLVTAAIIVLGSAAISWIAFERLVGRPFPPLVASLGILLVLTEIVGRYFYDGQAVAYPNALSPAGTFELFGAKVNYSGLMVFGIAAISIGILDVVFRRSRVGMQMRAMADTRVGAQLCGINPRRLVRIAFMVAGLSATIAGVLLGIQLNNVNPDLGGDLTFKVVAAVLAAGSSSFRGAIITCMLIGVAEALVTGYASPTYSSAIAFVLIIMVLLVRPNGLFEAPVEIEGEVG